LERYEKVHVKMWDDPAFVPLSTQARLLFIWSFTNSASTVSGLYKTSTENMGQALTEYGRDVDIAVIESALAELARKPLVKYDWDNEVIWVVNRVRYAVTNEATRKKAQYEVDACPESPLKHEFAAVHNMAVIATEAKNGDNVEGPRDIHCFICNAEITAKQADTYMQRCPSCWNALEKRRVKQKQDQIAVLRDYARDTGDERGNVQADRLEREEKMGRRLKLGEPPNDGPDPGALRAYRREWEKRQSR
jgi:Rieske Fe-S protein